MANEDKAARYQRLKRQASMLGVGLTALLLLALLLTGASARLRDVAADLARGSFVPTVLVYVVLLTLLSEALQLPLLFYRELLLERRYELSTESTTHWWLNHVRALGVALAFGLVGAVVVFLLLRWDPSRWWPIAAVCASVTIVALAQVAPVVLLPLFYDVKPLERTALAARLVSLSERAGARVIGVFEWRLSDRTRKANAVLVGIGRTRRILLSDTLLAGHSDEEIEVILAHELAHHVYRDIWTGIVVEAGVMTLALFLADLALTASVGSFGLAGKADPAALPLLLMTGGAVSLALLPFVNWLSRAHERRADRFALDMTENVSAFVTAMKRLAAQNLADDRPSPLVEALFYTHPPTAARLASAESWKEKNRGHRLVSAAG